MKTLKNNIPTSSKVFQQLNDLAETTKVVIISGLPGVGKSLYINELLLICKSIERPVDLIQWDVARKAFETEHILSMCPIEDGMLHNGMKLIAGAWLMDELELWLDEHKEDDNLLLIEAPLVGHRFVELINPTENPETEAFLASELCKVVMPIPTVEVREKIELERKRQVSEDAKVWSGAKPSVMLFLWKMTCELANDFGMTVDVSGQPPYDPEIYKFVFGEILKHRNFVPLIIDEIYSIPEKGEDSLHSADSRTADAETANFYCKLIFEKYPKEVIDAIADSWYMT